MTERDYKKALEIEIEDLNGIEVDESTIDDRIVARIDRDIAHSRCWCGESSKDGHTHVSAEIDGAGGG